MKLRTSLAAAGAAAVLATTGTLALPAVASAHSAATTLKLISVTNKTVNFGQTSGAYQDTDINAQGTTVGFDMLYYALTSSATASLNLTFDISGGFLYVTAKATVNSAKPIKGNVTGGTGSFTGATGTFTAKNLNKKGTRTLITIKYST
jgi:hypothetical protein